MDKPGTLLVALGRSAADAGLVRYAAKVAQWLGAGHVGFVHVLPSSASSSVAARVIAELEELAGAAGMPASVRTSIDVLSGPLTDRLLAFVAEKQSDVLLTGARRKTPGLRTLARRLAMKAPCSVWMVPEGAPAHLRRILVPIDFSEHSADALRTAISLAGKAGGARCLPLHVHFNEALVTYEGYEQVLRGEEKDEYRRFISSIDCRDVEVTPIFEESANVSNAIGRAAKSSGADLIVMATRGRSRSSSILLGSITEEAIIGARVPLLAVKHFGAHLGVLAALLDKRFLKKGGIRAD